MLQITPQHRLLLAVKPVDFRKGIDGLKALCRQKLLDDPFSGTVFVFTNRIRTSVKLLVYDASGFWLCQKRFSRGKLAWWPSGLSPSVELRSSELLILLAQGHPIKANLPDDWRSIAYAASDDSNKALVPS
ncbi:IS66 family insertion sequence element accessory protein TnpB [Legionella cincinnatiensis]|uniref:Transposase n=1 Tax=Legionella cincinnatiensis TaxID=28085 RepID=A0A378IKP4_9GAMM|nr:IS66 family insertion sequence element accessory protein TnpB [Legionella cincinnatiensis]KTC78751.1 transposase [Legionella cincinnatiensis]STX35342.1 transposase [Legionella cincinnatiensis]